MEIVIKDKWLNEAARCRMCTKIFCCVDHRIGHENSIHPKELRKILSDISNQGNLNTTVRSIKIPRMKHDKDAAQSLKAVKVSHSPDCTRKRKREAMASPMLQLKKKKRSLPPHMRTPLDSPKSPLALVNNGVKNESSVFITANNTVVMTSSPLTSPIFSSFVNLTPLDNSSPGLEPSIKRETIELESSGENEENDSSTDKHEYEEENGNSEMVNNLISTDLMRNVRINFLRETNIMESEYIQDNLENTRDNNKRDSGFQSECSNILGDNMSRKLSLDCNSSESSIRDCNISTDFQIGPMPNAILKDMYTEINDSFIRISDQLKSHPNITYERRNNTDLLELSFDVAKFDFMSTENFDTHSEINIIPEVVSERNDNNESNNIEFERSEYETQLEAVGYMDIETTDIFIPAKCFGTLASTVYELSTIHEVSHFKATTKQENNETFTEEDPTTVNQSESDFHPPAQSTFKKLHQESLSSAADSSEVPTIIPARHEQELSPNQPDLESSNNRDSYTVSTLSPIVYSDEDDGSLYTQPSKINESQLSFPADESIEDKERKFKPQCSETYSDIERSYMSPTYKNVFNESKCLDESTTSAKDTSLADKSVLLGGLNMNYKIRINNVHLAEKSLLQKCVSSITNKMVSLLPFNVSITKTCSQSYTIVDLDEFGKDTCGTQEHIRMRDPIREYTSTLEMSRKLLRPIEGRAPYYVPNSLVSSLVTFKKEENLGNDSLFSEDE